ncbi:hypothetical protein M569_10941, partial [Genlisea aurea]
RTVVVGVKLDSRSRELLTWTLVKVAQPGDHVVALHVLDANEIVDQEGKSSFLSLVKAFDAILAVYGSFCNLKQVDLRLKICRGSSVKRILIHESKAQNAVHLVVGASQTRHRIRSPVSVAKHCAGKLPKDCSVIAVDNGKIAFHRQSRLLQRQHLTCNDYLNSLQRSLVRSFRLKNGHSVMKPMLTWEEEGAACGGRSSSSSSVLASAAPPPRNCSICCSVADAHRPRIEWPAKDGDMTNNSMAIVAVQKLEADAAPQELRPGWPLLRQAVIVSNRRRSHRPKRDISVVQWALMLPDRYCYRGAENSGDDDGSLLNEETGAIVPVGDGTASAGLSSPDQNHPSLPKELEGLHEKYSATCRLFNLEELASATSNFAPETMIGKGGSSQVYRGCLPDGKELAVKILKPSEDALKEFVLEIEIITAVNHKNIISLFGFCFEDNRLLLVYDFLPRGSLEANLHAGINEEASAFGWNERYRVAVGVAEALDYLHSREDLQVIHRDVKSSNILLSDDFEPQLSDFGLAKWASSTSSPHITSKNVAGTFGYLAPEYFMYGKVNEKIDVYAYGVVLLELLTGRKPINSNCPKGQESLVLWAKPLLHSEKFTTLLDANFGRNYDHQQAERMALAASLCVRRAPRARPQMNTILKLLQGDEEVTAWAHLQVNVLAEASEEETSPSSTLQSHLSLALLGVEEEDSHSLSSLSPSVSLEDYLQGRWSRSSSFD